MKSFFGGLWDFFKPLPPRIKKPRTRDNRPFPPPDCNRIVEVTVKNKDRLKKLKLANKELCQQLNNQTEIVSTLVKELSQLKREVAELRLGK